MKLRYERNSAGKKRTLTEAINHPLYVSRTGDFGLDDNMQCVAPPAYADAVKGIRKSHENYTNIMDDLCDKTERTLGIKMNPMLREVNRRADNPTPAHTSKPRKRSGKLSEDFYETPEMTALRDSAFSGEGDDDLPDDLWTRVYDALTVGNASGKVSGIGNYRRYDYRDETLYGDNNIVTDLEVPEDPDNYYLAVWQPERSGLNTAVKVANQFKDYGVECEILKNNGTRNPAKAWYARIKIPGEYVDAYLGEDLEDGEEDGKVHLSVAWDDEVTDEELANGNLFMLRDIVDSLWKTNDAITSTLNTLKTREYDEPEEESALEDILADINKYIGRVNSLIVSASPNGDDLEAGSEDIGLEFPEEDE